MRINKIKIKFNGYKKEFKKSGFTLIELLVVISIIGFLATASIVAFNNARIKARDARRVADLKQISTALELYFDDHNFYPPSPCGYDCDNYYHSTNSSWQTLQTYLAPYLPKLPVDPINNLAGPWTTGHLSYAYGDVGRYTYKSQYVLTTQLEGKDNSLRCEIKNYRWYFDNRAWCIAWGGSYSNQIYEKGTRPN